jgi:hypothetical protein
MGEGDSLLDMQQSLTRLLHVVIVFRMTINNRYENWSVSKHDGEDAWITVTLDMLQRDDADPDRADGAAWRAVYSIASDDGRPWVVGVRLEPVDSASTVPLSAQLARELLKPGAALDFAREGLRDMLDHPNAAERAERERRLSVHHGLNADELLSRHRGKRRGDYFYARIAALYVDAHTAGSRRPVSDVAAALPATYEAPFVRDAVSKARARGLLAAPPGARRAGGVLTDLGQKVLREGSGDDVPS